MSELNQQTGSSGNDFFAPMPFVKLLGGFWAAMQPGKLILALAGIVTIFLSGWILDWLTPASDRVVINAANLSAEGYAPTELDAYLSGDYALSHRSFNALRDDMRRSNEENLKRLLTGSAMNLNTTEAEKWVREGKALSEIENKYLHDFDKAIPLLQKRYNISCDRINDEYQKIIDMADDSSEKQARREERDHELKQLKDAYMNIFDAVTGKSTGTALQQNEWLKRLIVADLRALAEYKAQEEKKANNDMELVLNTVQLAQLYQIAKAHKGAGIFATLVDLKTSRLHKAVGALVWNHDLSVVKNQLADIVKSAGWLWRFHWIYAIFMCLICLAVWSIVGGAICRITALQFARDERIGALRAAKFSSGKFASFFSAPLIPIVVVIIISIAIFVPSLITAIPRIGEMIGGILLLLALVGGFVIALVIVGLLAGFNLMYPTIAVEGSDSFDAISRPYSYIFARPWRMGFYSFIAAVYGSICYLFVHFFACLMLTATRSCVGAAVNLDGSSFINISGKLNAMWPAPTAQNLLPSINWMGLNWSETFAAAWIWIWVSLTVAVVLAFVISFFFSENTVIYFLLRQRVDGTDLEDVYLIQDVEDLVAQEARAEESQEPQPTQAPSEQSPPDSQVRPQTQEPDESSS